jgi:hypothetical protein
MPGHASSGLLDQYVRTIEAGEALVLDDYVYPSEIIKTATYSVGSTIQTFKLKITAQ